MDVLDKGGYGRDEEVYRRLKPKSPLTQMVKPLNKRRSESEERSYLSQAQNISSATLTWNLLIQYAMKQPSWTHREVGYS